MRPTWDKYWLNRARLNATMSTCSRRQVGAVAVLNQRSFGDAFNGPAAGAKHCYAGGCARCADDSIPSGQDLDRCVCNHAEANLVSFCARRGSSMEDCVVYCTHKPCMTCIKLLVSAGVSEVVYDQDYPVPYDEIPGVLMRRFKSQSDNWLLSATDFTNWWQTR